MTFVNDTRSFEANLASRVGDFFRSLSVAREKRRLYETTVRELSALDRHMLSDLGMSRGDIPEVASRAVYGK